MPERPRAFGNGNGFRTGGTAADWSAVECALHCIGPLSCFASVGTTHSEQRGARARAMSLPVQFAAHACSARACTPASEPFSHVSRRYRLPVRTTRDNDRPPTVTCAGQTRPVCAGSATVTLQRGQRVPHSLPFGCAVLRGSQGSAQPLLSRTCRQSAAVDDYSRQAAARVTAADGPTQIRLGVRRGLSGVLHVCRSSNGHVRLR